MGNRSGPDVSILNPPALGSAFGMTVTAPNFIRGRCSGPEVPLVIAVSIIKYAAVRLANDLLVAGSRWKIVNLIRVGSGELGLNDDQQP